MPKTTPITNLEDLDDYFHFEHDGKTHVFPLRVKDVMTPGFVRQNRRRDEIDYFLTLFEALCAQDADVNERLEPSEDEIKKGREIMKVIDKLEWDDHRKLQKQLVAAMRVALGE